MNTKLLSVTQYAKLVNITVQAVTLQIRENRLPTGITSEKVGGTHIIKIES